VALEYVEGPDPGAVDDRPPAPDLDTVRSLVEQIAKGLQAFHRKEMLHQDLRPENIMIDRTGTVKIIDFGAVHVAGLAEGSTEARATHAHRRLAAVHGARVLHRRWRHAGSDLFSLAVLTYQMLTGQLPYGLQRTSADLARLRYVSVRSRRPELPLWLDAVLQRALHPQPHRRQEAISEFVHDLRSPGHRYQRDRLPALIERNPLVFWQSLSVLLAALVLVLLALRMTGL
jgi:serine/threonine protein kinase